MQAIAQCNGGGENERLIPLPEDQQSFILKKRMLLLLATMFRGGDAELLFCVGETDTEGWMQKLYTARKGSGC